jgi:hypothetical protein
MRFVIKNEELPPVIVSGVAPFLIQDARRVRLRRQK